MDDKNGNKYRVQGLERCWFLRPQEAVNWGVRVHTVLGSMTCTPYAGTKSSVDSVNKEPYFVLTLRGWD